MFSWYRRYFFSYSWINNILMFPRGISKIIPRKTIGHITRPFQKETKKREIPFKLTELCFKSNILTRFACFTTCISY